MPAAKQANACLASGLKSTRHVLAQSCHECEIRIKVPFEPYLLLHSFPLAACNDGIPSKETKDHYLGERPSSFGSVARVQGLHWAASNIEILLRRNLETHHAIPTLHQNRANLEPSCIIILQHSTCAYHNLVNINNPAA